MITIPSLLEHDIQTNGVQGAGDDLAGPGDYSYLMYDYDPIPPRA